METSAISPSSPLTWPYMDVAMQWAKIGVPFALAMLILALLIALVTYLIKLISAPFRDSDSEDKEKKEKAK